MTQNASISPTLGHGLSTDEDPFQTRTDLDIVFKQWVSSNVLAR